jgi:S-DNA-T family DNA segregation ATPase FtsK/SpoIIIE
MLFLWPGTSTLLRGQGTYLDDEEIDRVVDFVSTGEPNFVNELVNLKLEDKRDAERGQLQKRDDLYESAVDVVVREGRGSVSLLQRVLGIGYGRAARLIDYMAEDGVVGPYAGSQAREVLITVAEWEQMQGYETESEPDPVPSRKRRSNKVSLRDGDDDAFDAADYYEDEEIPFEDDDRDQYVARLS